MIPVELSQILSAGGNLAMIAVAIGFWKLDRRVFKIELHLWNDRRGKDAEVK